MHCISCWRGNLCAVLWPAAAASADRLWRTRVLLTPAPCYRAHIATCPASLLDSWLSWKGWPTKTRSIFLAEPLPHAFRSVFCFNKQATLTGLFFIPPKARGTDTSRYLPVNNAVEKRIQPPQSRQNVSLTRIKIKAFNVVVFLSRADRLGYLWEAEPKKPSLKGTLNLQRCKLTFPLFFLRRKRTFVYRWGL